jgi:spore coat polysaccharide biosynthesis protein SpsF (cytidylyltransferase family)
MIGCIIQARMGSSRLLNKVLMKIDENDSVLSSVIKQIQNCKLIEKIIVATTNKREDDLIRDYVTSVGIECFRGNALDLLTRYYRCAKKYSLSAIVRITSDCPLIDPTVVDTIVSNYKENSYEYVSNYFPRTYPIGMGVEIFSFKALEYAWKNATLPSEREHVSPFFNNQNQLRKFNVKHIPDLSYIRVTVDRIDDLKLIQLLVKKISARPILLTDILNVVRSEPELLTLNNYDRDEGYVKTLERDKKFLARQNKK